LSRFRTFAVAPTDRYRIEVLPAPGLGEDEGNWVGVAPSMVIEREMLPIPVSSPERSAHRRRMVDRASAMEGGENLRIPDVPEFKPPLARVRFSEDGQLLVFVSMPSGLEDEEWTEPMAFDAFDWAGHFRGRVILPGSFVMTRMRGDRVWGVFRGEYDEESIRRYRIVWPGPDATAEHH
jgi:hypothetical protein